MANEVFYDLKGVWSRKGQNVGLCRWFGWYLAMRECLMRWHSLLVCLIFLTVHFGHGSLKAIDLNMKSAKVKPAEANQMMSFRESHAQANKQRSGCKDTLHFCTSILANADFHRMPRMVCVALGPLHRWYSDQVKTNRSCKAAHYYLLAAAADGQMEPLRHIWRSPQGYDALEQMGFLARCGSDKVAGVAEDGPDVMEDDDWAQLLARLLTAFVGCRLRSQLWLEYG